ncbi:MAG: hypothetical protein ACI9P7_002160, partial [Candidatus Azotimanducaceae bacterium]
MVSIDTVVKSGIQRNIEFLQHLVVGAFYGFKAVYSLKAVYLSA